jgi:hypothetical protein
VADEPPADHEELGEVVELLRPVGDDGDLVAQFRL